MSCFEHSPKVDFDTLGALAMRRKSSMPEAANSYKHLSKLLVEEPFQELAKSLESLMGA
jgi:hypothetical protein